MQPVGRYFVSYYVHEALEYNLLAGILLVDKSLNNKILLEKGVNGNWAL